MPHKLGAAMLAAERCAPPDRAAALIRLARVITTDNYTEAERLLDRGLELLTHLPAHDRTAIAPQAVCLTACVSPDRAFALHREIDGSERSDKFLIDMASHGHVAAAVAFLIGWSEQNYPYHAARSILHKAQDDDARRGILRRALHASAGRVDVDGHELRSLFALLRLHWPLLPHDEARDELRRLVRYIQTTADDLQGSFRVGGPQGAVTFTTEVPSLLFELLGPLRRFDPELAAAAIREHPQLARASAVYPNGHDSFVHRPTERLSDEALAQWKKDWTGFALGSRFFKIEDEQAGDFKNAFEHADRSYARDTHTTRPNPYPRDCWPSAEDVRVILWAAGHYGSEDGARLLDRIPDVVLRLFAEIEFAAGTAGLAQVGGITREQLPRYS